jgi:hypothetical protein
MIDGRGWRACPLRTDPAMRATRNAVETSPPPTPDIVLAIVGLLRADNRHHRGAPTRSDRMTFAASVCCSRSKSFAAERAAISDPPSTVRARCSAG